MMPQVLLDYSGFNGSVTAVEDRVGHTCMHAQYNIILLSIHFLISYSLKLSSCFSPSFFKLLCILHLAQTSHGDVNLTEQLCL